MPTNRFVQRIQLRFFCVCVFVRGIKCRNQLALFACLPFFAFAKHENKKRSRVATNLMSSSFNVTPLDAD